MARFENGDLLIGRTGDLDRLRAALAVSKSQAMPAVIRILGGSGIGKSTLLRGFVAEAKRSDWLTAQIACHPASSQRPLTALAAVIRSLLRSLGSKAAHYASGLEPTLAVIAPGLDRAIDAHDATLTLAPAQVEAGFLRLLQGVLNDYSVLIALDDAGSADVESLRIIDYVLATVAGCPFAVVTAEQRDAGLPFSAAQSLCAVTLGPLDDTTATELVAANFPGASPLVARAIVAYAGGIPLDLATLAANAASEDVRTAEAVHEGVASVVRSELQKIAPDARTVLQLCSLIPEPVPLRLLAAASGMSESDLVAMVTHDSDRYLVRSGTTVGFRHDVIRDSVRSTVANELLLARRALDAQLNSVDRNSDDLERTANLAAQCGERELQRSCLIRLADAAYRASRFESAVGYYRRANDVRPPRGDEYIDFYVKFTTSLRANDYDAEAARVLTDALRDGEELQIREGLGVLAAALVLTLCMLDEFDRAKRISDYYFTHLESSEDRSEVLASAACMFADAMQIPQLKDTLGRAAELPRATNYANAKLEYARATAESRLGDHEQACRALKSAAFYAELDRSLLSYNIRFDQLFVDFRHYGNAALKDALPQIAREVSAETGTHAFATYLASFSDFLDGEWERALARLADMNRRRFTPAIRANFMSVPAAIAAFTLQPSPYADELRADVDVLVREVHDRSAVQLGSWWIAWAANADRAAAEPIASKLRKWSVKAPAFSSVSFMPVSLALYAERAGDRDMLAEVAKGVDTYDASPWMEANVLLACGVAMRALGDREGITLLRDSAQRFKRLRAPFLAAYAAARAGHAASDELRLLADLHVMVGSGAERSRRQPGTRTGPTVRELEVARLVADGYTNRKIAQELFLSERTVEVHITNLFAKLGVTSRTHLARWVFENEGARA